MTTLVTADLLQIAPAQEMDVEPDRPPVQSEPTEVESMAAMLSPSNLRNDPPVMDEKSYLDPEYRTASPE